jgi:hypothetical protein
LHPCMACCLALCSTTCCALQQQPARLGVFGPRRLLRRPGAPRASSVETAAIDGFSPSGIPAAAHADWASGPAEATSPNSGWCLGGAARQGRWVAGPAPLLPPSPMYCSARLLLQRSSCYCTTSTKCADRSYTGRSKPGRTRSGLPARCVG